MWEQSEFEIVFVESAELGSVTGRVRFEPMTREGDTSRCTWRIEVPNVDTISGTTFGATPRQTADLARRMARVRLDAAVRSAGLAVGDYGGLSSDARVRVPNGHLLVVKTAALRHRPMAWREQVLDALGRTRVDVVLPFLVSNPYDDRKAEADSLERLEELGLSTEHNICELHFDLPSWAMVELIEHDYKPATPPDDLLYVSGSGTFVIAGSSKKRLDVERAVRSVVDEICASRSRTLLAFSARDTNSTEILRRVFAEHGLHPRADVFYVEQTTPYWIQLCVGARGHPP